MSFTRYPNYKDSGVEWLGEVPGHWDIPQIKRTTYLKARVGWKGLTSEEFRERSFAYLVTGSDFREKFVKWDECYQVEQERYDDDPFIQLQNGDLLITKDGTIGKLAIVSNLDRPACLNSGIFVVRPRNTYTTDFMYWILSSNVFSVFCDLESFGSTINHLYQNVFEQFAFPAPPESEQTQIAAFLDRETAKIDALVAEQRRLMELLKEKRQAVISHAVTQGLNPHAPMKPSGIEWLGDVPAHWEVKKIKFVTANVKAGPFGSALTKDVYVSAGYRVYGQEQVIPNDFTLGDYFIAPAKYDELSQYSVSPGDILISCVGTFGKIAIVPDNIEPGIINPRLIRLRCSHAIKAEYLVEVMRSNVTFEQFSSFTRGGTMDVINIGTLNEIYIALPPKDEQQELLSFVHREIGKFDTLTTEAQRAIDLLQERRTALISAAVTGQIDVRPLCQVQKVPEGTHSAGAGGTAIRSGESSAA